jgi:hypothetical protein
LDRVFRFALFPVFCRLLSVRRTLPMRISTLSRWLTVSTMVCLVSAHVWMLYPFQFLPPTLTSYAIVFISTACLCAFSLLPSALFLRFCWRRYSSTPDTTTQWVLLVASTGLLASSILCLYPIPLSRSVIETFGLLLPLVAAAHHAIIFVVSLGVLYARNRSKV